MAAMQHQLESSRASGLSRAIGVAVAFYANPESGLSFPSDETLLGWGFSERTIRDALRQLEELGELQRQPQLESHLRRRVYLVGCGQLSMLDQPAEHSAGAEHLAPALPGRPARAWKEPKNLKEPQAPPDPPQAGGMQCRRSSAS